MKARNAMYIAIGAGAALAYQKYKKPMMKKVEQQKDQVLKKVDQKIENMM